MLHTIQHVSYVVPQSGLSVGTGNTLKLYPLQVSIQNNLFFRHHTEGLHTLHKLPNDELVVFVTVSHLDQGIGVVVAHLGLGLGLGFE